MATEVVATVIPGGGGDYTSLAGFESGEQRDLVAADEIAVASCSSGTDAGIVNFIGWTADETRYIEVRPANGHEHGGLASAGFKITTDTGTTVTLAEYCRLRGIVVENTGTGMGIRVGSSGNEFPCLVDSCVVVGAGSDGIADLARNTTRSTYVNNIIYGSWTDGFELAASGAGGANFYNNTVIDCVTGIKRSTRTLRPKNNIVQGGTTCISGTLTDNQTNLTSDATGDIQATLTFVNAANDDYHLADTDTDAIGAGTDLSADADFAFSTDIDGDSRPAGNWDIGADQTAATAANEMSGTPSSQATDASGTMDAVVSGSGAPQAGVATATGELDTIDRASGAPQAGTTTSTGTLAAVASGAGAPQSGAATASGAAQAVVSAAGACQAGSPTSAGTLMVVVSMSGAPQAGLADGFGTADDGQAPLITPKRKGMIVDVGEVLR